MRFDYKPPPIPGWEHVDGEWVLTVGAHRLEEYLDALWEYSGLNREEYLEWQSQQDHVEINALEEENADVMETYPMSTTSAQTGTATATQKRRTRTRRVIVQP